MKEKLVKIFMPIAILLLFGGMFLLNVNTDSGGKLSGGLVIALASEGEGDMSKYAEIDTTILEKEYPYTDDDGYCWKYKITTTTIDCDGRGPLTCSESEKESESKPWRVPCPGKP